MPNACSGIYSATTQVTEQSLYQCPQLAAIVLNFTTVNCESSFAKICQAEYTDNPPFSCTKETTPEFLTTLGSALANSSALWSFSAIVISLSLKRMYPGGIYLKHYQNGKYVPALAAVHPGGDEDEQAELDQKIPAAVVDENNAAN